MTAPVIRQYSGTIPDKGQAQTAFDTNVDAFLDWQALQFAPDLVAFGEFASDTGAALVAGNLPPLTGRALDAVRVNAAADGVEFVDVTAAGWALLDDANATAQRTTLGLGSAALMVDSADANLANDPDGAARRDIVAGAIAAAPGRLKHIQTVTLGAAAATLSIALPITGYKRFTLIYEFKPVTNAQRIQFQIQNTSNVWRTTGYNSQSMVRETKGTSTTGFILSDSTGNAAGQFGVRGSADIEKSFNAGARTSIRVFGIDYYSDANPYPLTSAGAYATAEQHKTIRAIAASGNIDAGGTLELWGEPT